MNSQYNRLRMVFMAVITLVVAVAGFVFFYNQLRPKSKAAPTGTAELSIVAVNNPPMDASNNIRVGVRLDPNGSTTSLYSFDVQVTFDATKLEFQNTGGVEANVFLPTGALKEQIKLIGNNTIRIVGTRTGSAFSSTNKQVADITFHVKQGQSFPLTFSWGPTALETTLLVKIPLTLASNSSSSAGTSSTGGGASLSFTPNASTYQVGNMVSVDVILDSAGRQIGATTVNFTFDQAKLTYVSTLINTGVFNGATVTPAASGSTVSFQAARSSGISGNLRVATVRFTAKAAGTATFTFNKASSSITTYGASPQNILETVNPSTITINAQGASSSGGSSGGGLGGGSGTPGEHVESNGDILHINSATFDQAPLRYEQIVKLEEGDYILSGSAHVYAARGRGVLIALACGESNCGDGKKLNDIFGTTPLFAISTDFQRKEATIHISGNQKDKKLVVRIFVEDGSEADFDYVSLTDVWGGERMTNWHFENIYKVIHPRSYPQYWDMDAAGQVLSNIDKQQGTDKYSLFINSSSRQ